MKELFFTYIMAGKKNGTLYVGMTNNLQKRVYEHQNHIVEGFTAKYKVDLLVYYEVFSEALLAIKREKQLKKWNRDWKIKLIEEKNLEWKDLSKELSY